MSDASDIILYNRGTQEQCNAPLHFPQDTTSIKNFIFYKIYTRFTYLQGGIISTGTFKVVFNSLLSSSGNANDLLMFPPSTNVSILHHPHVTKGSR